jgi:IclR family transcriptional regulator, acetate operon repressor
VGCYRGSFINLGNQNKMTDAAQSTEDRYALRSVNRALDVLEALGKAGNEGMTVAGVAEQIGVSKSTAFALLQTLLLRNFVADVRFGGSRRYRLGLSLVYLGDRAAEDVAVSQLAQPVLRELTELTGLTSRLAILDHGYAVAISRVDAPGILRIASALGQRELPRWASRYWPSYRRRGLSNCWRKPACHVAPNTPS